MLISASIGSGHDRIAAELARRRPHELRPTMVELTDGLDGQRERQAALFGSDPADVVADVAARTDLLAGTPSRTRSRARRRRAGRPRVAR